MGKGTGKGGCGKEAKRTVLWVFFAINVLVTTIYFILCFFCFNKLLTSSGEMQLDSKDLFKNKIWLGLLAAVLFSGILMLGFDLMSCVIIIKRSINRSGPGFGFGFMVAFSFTMAFYCLLAALVMDSFRSTVTSDLQTKSSSWTSTTTDIYIACEIFAFINCGWLLLYFVVLLVNQGGFFEQLQGGWAGLMQRKYGRMEDMYAAQPMMKPPMMMQPGAMPVMQPAMQPMMMQPGAMQMQPAMMQPGAAPMPAPAVPAQ